MVAETIDAMDRLVAAGKILRWGVSNLDIDDMEELIASGGNSCQTDQILYNLTRRGPEYDLIPWLARHRMPVMAYSPVEQGRLVSHPGLAELAAKRDATPAQMAIAWLLSKEGVIPIPKAGSVDHVRENCAALDVDLSDADFEQLNAIFAPPRTSEPLAML